MIDSHIKNIIFDFGGVLIRIDYNATLQAFKELGIANIETMYTQAEQVDLFNAIETGKISAQQFINSLLDHLPSGTSPNKVVAAWNAMILDVPTETIQLLDRLSEQGYHLFLLSNTNSIHIDVALRRWSIASSKDIYSYFKHVYLSHEINMRKPDPQIFEFVCMEQGLDPNETLFIDDSIQHIEGARTIGLNTHHLLSMKELYTLFS